METFDKKQLTERDICTKYITPALTNAGWDRHTQFLEEVSFTDGRVIVRGRVTARGSRKRADYILYYRPNVPIAVIEAKDNNHSVGDGMQQALDYAETLKPTKHVWFCEHPYPEGYKSYSKTKPIRIEEFEREKKWWKRRRETPHAWKVSAKEIKDSGYNLDIKNPHDAGAGHGDPAELLADYQKLQAEIGKTRDELKQELMAALEGKA